MDFSFRQNEEDLMLIDDIFGNKTLKCCPEFMDENWSSGTDDIFGSIFPMDFQNNLTDHQGEFGSLEGYNRNMKIEQRTEDYETNLSILPEPLLSHSSGLSSNSSDSGLSSDNIDAEISPPYEPTSPISPGPSKIAKGDKRSLRLEKAILELVQPGKIKIDNDYRPKVIVQKVPQVMTLSNNFQTHLTKTQMLKHQLQPLTRQPNHIQTIMNQDRKSDIKIVKLSPQIFTTSNNKAVTIQVKNSNSGTKIQAKPGTLFLNKTKLPEMKKIVHVRNNNPRSILIPVSLQDIKELKAFKIVNTTAVQSTNAKKVQDQEANQQIQIQQVAKPLVLKEVDLKEKMKEDCFLGNFSNSDSIIIEDGYDDERSYALDSEVSYPKLALNSEERRLLNKEGISLPSHYPLTKHEERELKRIRRKIRNKISAQDSRKRKKEYVDGLEERVKQCTEENQSLMKKIKQLQNQNHNLVSQMIKLQSLLTKGTNKSTQPTTCLMVLLLSLALVAAPNLRLGQNAKKGDLEEAVQETILQNRRSLLFNNKDQSTDVFDEEVNMSDIVSVLEFNNERESNAEYKINSNTHSAESSLEEPKCKKMKLVPPGFFDEVDDENWYTSKNDRAKTFGKNGMEYLEQSNQNFQNSAFNIGKSSQISSAKHPSKQDWLDKDIPEILLPTPNGFYKLSNNGITSVSLERPPKLTVLDVTANQIYTKGIKIKRNSSDIRHSKIY